MSTISLGSAYARVTTKIFGTLFYESVFNMDTLTRGDIQLYSNPIKISYGQDLTRSTVIKFSATSINFSLGPDTISIFGSFFPQGKTSFSKAPLPSLSTKATGNITAFQFLQGKVVLANITGLNIQLKDFSSDPLQAMKKAFSGDDAIIGSDGPDIINGYLGNDIIKGLGGDDTLTSGGGSDTLDGGPGNDLIIAGPGKCDITTGSGNDTVRVGFGNISTRIFDFSVVGDYDKLDLRPWGITQAEQINKVFLNGSTFISDKAGAGLNVELVGVSPSAAISLQYSNFL